MIYYDLTKSEFVVRYDEFEFYFSSQFYKNKFLEMHIDYVRDETLKLASRFKCGIYADSLLLLELYKKIEKRGFYVKYNGIVINNNYYINCKLDETWLEFDSERGEYTND